MVYKNLCAFRENRPSIGKVNQSLSYLHQRHKNKDIFENLLNPTMSVFIEKLSLSTLRWAPICQGFCHFPAFIHHFRSAKSATRSIRVNPSDDEATFVLSTRTQRFSKSIQTLPCWYSLESFCWVPMSQGFSHFSVFFASFCIGQISHHQQYKG